MAVCIKRFCKSRVDNVKELFLIPPTSESMAGVIILFVFTNSVANSIWMFNAWSPFIFKLFDNSNLLVGLMSAINGACELTFALISGHIADTRWGPSRTLVFAVRFGLATLFVVLLGIWTERGWVLILAQCFDGTYMGLSFTCLESVFAQCLRRGERDRLYSIKFSCEASGPIIGLVLSAVLYSIVGNAWNVRVLRWVMTAGLILHMGSMAAFLWRFQPLPSHLERRPDDDTRACEDAGPARSGGSSAEPGAHPASHEGKLGVCEVEDSRIVVAEAEDDLHFDAAMPGPSTEAVNRARTALTEAVCSRAPMPTGPYEPSVCTALDEGNASFSFSSVRHRAVQLTGRQTTKLSNALEDDGAASNGQFASAPSPTRTREEGGTTLHDETALPGSGAGHFVDAELEKAKGCRRLVMKWIPLRWYPLLVALSDIILTVGSGMTTQYFTLFMMTLYGVGPVAMALLNLANSFLIATLAIVSGFAGRRWGRVRAILPPRFVGSFILLWMALARGTSYAPKWLMCVAFVFRNAFMNCSAGLSRALIMDLVPENKRGRWNAVESVQSAGWSGTALLGGYFADLWGYGAAFILTFGFHIFASVMLLPLTMRNDSRLPHWIPDDDTTTQGHEAVGELTEANVRKIGLSPALSKEYLGIEDTPMKSPKDPKAEHTASELST